MAVFCSYVGLDLQLCLVGKEEEFKKLYPLHQLSDSHWRIGLLVLSLLKQMVVCLVRKSRYRLRGEINASISNGRLHILGRVLYFGLYSVFEYVSICLSTRWH